MNEDRITLARLMPHEVAENIVSWHTDPEWAKAPYSELGGRLSFDEIKILVATNTDCNCINLAWVLGDSYEFFKTVCIKDEDKLNEFVDALIRLGVEWGGNEMDTYWYREPMLLVWALGLKAHGASEPFYEKWCFEKQVYEDLKRQEADEESMASLRTLACQ